MYSCEYKVPHCFLKYHIIAHYKVMIEAKAGNNNSYIKANLYFWSIVKKEKSLIMGFVNEF